MKNADVFNDYDMIVSYTQSSINHQLSQLQALGTIAKRLIIVQTFSYEGDQLQMDYKVCTSSDEIPRDEEGNPLYAYIDVEIWPQINITESGYDVTFVLNLERGTACFWSGYGPMAHLSAYDVANWSYGIILDMNFARIYAEDVGKGIAVPENVAAQLKDFHENDFKVTALFMNFQSTELLSYDPATTSVNGAGDLAKKQLVEFMSAYLDDLEQTGNPYLLGYSITSDDKTTYEEDQKVPKSLRPVSTTYSMYHDPERPEWSNLNFVLVTGWRDEFITKAPDKFDDNWFREEDAVDGKMCDGKMYYSKNVLIELYVLKPIYESLKDGTYKVVKNCLGGSYKNPGNTYEEGKEVLTDASGIPIGYSFTIRNDTGGNRRYENRFNAVFGYDVEAGETVIRFDGRIFIKKKDSKDMGFCTAKAWASSSVSWTGEVCVRATKTEAHDSVLEFDYSQPFAIVEADSDSGKNDCAKGWNAAASIIEELTAITTLIAGDGWLSELLMDGLDVSIEEFGDIGDVFENLGGSAETILMLPAGDTFFFSNPRIDSAGHLGLELVFKSSI